MSRYAYSQKYGLQAGPIRQAGIMAVFERVIDRLNDKMAKIVVQWGDTEGTLDLTESVSIDYPEWIMRLPHIVITFVSEAMREPGIGRVMIDGDESLFGFTKIVQFYFDIWTRRSLERILVSDAIVYCLGSKSSMNHFRKYGIRDLKHVGTQARNYEQERSALYQRMTAQQGARVFRQILQYEVEFDLVSVPEVEAEIIEQIVIRGDATTYVGEFETVLGGTTELLLDKELINELEGVIP